MAEMNIKLLNKEKNVGKFYEFVGNWGKQNKNDEKLEVKSKQKFFQVLGLIIKDVLYFECGEFLKMEVCEFFMIQRFSLTSAPNE